MKINFKINNIIFDNYDNFKTIFFDLKFNLNNNDLNKKIDERLSEID